MQLSFDHVSLTLRGRRILDDVTGRFQAGRLTVILGANGAGKSSLLSCLAGLRTPETGTIMLDEKPVQDWSNRHRAQHIGLLPQKPDIHWNVDVKTIVSLGRFPHAGRWGFSAQDQEAVTNALAATGCTDLADRKALRLSGGEQSRVLLARVLAGEPKWLLADEPLANLDPAHQFDVLERLGKYAAAGNGVIVVLHDLTQAARFADDILIMNNGQILAEGPCQDVLTEDNIAEAYGISVQMETSDSGEPLVIPIGKMA